MPKSSSISVLAAIHRAASGLIHPTSWKMNSANFAMTEFSEVRIAPVQSLQSNTLRPRGEGAGGGPPYRGPCALLSHWVTQANQRGLKLRGGAYGLRPFFYCKVLQVRSQG